MPQPGRILWFVVFAAAVLLRPGKAAAQVLVTPTVKTTPPGQLIVVNNGPGDQFGPHVDGDLVCYSDLSSGNTLIRYHNLATGTDNGVPPPLDNRADTLCDVRGTTIVFSRSGATDSIFTFEGTSSTLTEIDQTPGSQRVGGQIGVLDQNGQPVHKVATATTDITGFYFFATMSVLNQGATYTVAVTGLPPCFVNTPPPPPSPAFMWSESGMMIGNFVLN